MIMKQGVSIILGGQEIKGIISGSSFDLDVMITHPFAGKSKGLYSPSFARADRDKWFYMDGEITGYGLETARALLKEIYSLNK